MYAGTVDWWDDARTVDWWDDAQEDRSKSDGEQGRNGHRPVGISSKVIRNAWSVMITIEVGRGHTLEDRASKRGRESFPQMVLICQPADTRLKGDDWDALGTIKLTAKDLRGILIHGKHFPFFTPREREEGVAGHWETRMWETCDIAVWGTTRDLGFPVT